MNGNDEDEFNYNNKCASIGFFQNVINDLKRQLENKKRQYDTLVKELNSIGNNYLNLSENKLKLLEENSNTKSQMIFLKNEINMKRKYLDGILSSLDNQDQLNLNSNDNNNNKRIMILLNELQKSIIENNELMERKKNKVDFVNYIELPKDINNNLSLIIK
jgi:hypothetical protein